MPEKPTYEELEQRIQKLEQAEFKRKRADKTLRESQARFQLLYERAPLGYQSLDEDGNIIEVNPAWLDILGYSREEVIGKSFSEFLHLDWKDHFKEMFPRFKAIGEVLGVEFEMVKKDGSTILVLFNGKIGKDKDGGFQQTHCIFNDISKRKRAEEALRKSKDDMKGILDATTETIVLIDRQGMVIMANQTVCERLGTKKEDFIGRCIYDFFSLEVAEKRRRKWEEVFNTGKLVSFEDSRESMTFEQRAYPVFNGGNRVERVAIFARNVTERKQAEDALRESEERYRSFFKNNHSIMLLIDPENADIVDANPAAISYYGWSHEDITGKKITDINILTKEKIFQEMEQAKKEQRHHFYFRHRLSNGKIRDVEVYSGLITIRNKNFLFSIIYDTTDRKLAQSALIESERELKIKAKDLEELNAALKVLLNKRQEDKEELEEGILSNVRTLIEPYIVKLKRSKLPQSQKTLLNILESNLNEIVSPFTRKLSSKYLNLTPTQIQVANLVKHGKTNKDISEILHVAGRTIAFHRENIRKKLDLTNKKTNLKTYLMSID